MGALLCCFRVPDVDGQEAQAAGVHTNCICHRCLAQSLENLYNLVLQRGQVQAAIQSEQGPAPSASAFVVEDSSITRTYRAPPRPLPYDDPRCSGLHHQRVRLGSSYDKASSHLQEESDPLRRSCDDADVETTGKKGKWNESDFEGESKLRYTESSLNLSKKVTDGDEYSFHSSEDEDEDVCPTCLEEYVSENPRIILQCSHHFHLSCIYEWMERSEACPVCGKVMLFDETR